MEKVRVCVVSYPDRFFPFLYLGGGKGSGVTPTAGSPSPGDHFKACK